MSETKAPRKLSPAELAILAARSNFGAFISLLWPDFQRPAHIETLLQLFERIVSGDLRRVIVAAPPRHGKSATLSSYGVAFFLGRHPRASVIFVGHSAEFAADWGWNVRQVMMNPIYRQLFPDAALHPTTAAATRFRTQKNGSYVATGRDGAITGRGADLLLIDDLVKGDEEMSSAVLRRQIHRWYANVASTRLSPMGRVCIVNTRWHVDDLCGHLLSEHPADWHAVNLKAIAGADDPLGRKEGEPLWPEMFSLEYLEAQRELMGSASFASLYQGEPTVEGGGILKAELFQPYTELPDLYDIVLSADTAFSTRSTADWTVVTTWGIGKVGYYLIDVYRKRVSLHELEQHVIALADKFRPRALLVEAKGSGISLLQALEHGTRIPLKPVMVTQDKVSRANAIVPLIESRRVFVPARAPWLADFLDEVASFPAGRHDDQVDSAVMALTFMRDQASGSPIIHPIRLREVSSVFDDTAVPGHCHRSCLEQDLDNELGLRDPYALY